MKRVWTVIVPGFAPFSMVLMEGSQDHEGALREARLIWPVCELKL